MSLSDHIRTGVTTLCYCWVVQRQDGVVIGFTDHDEDVTVEGVVCHATTGITTTKFVRTLGLTDDNLDVDGVIDNDLLTTEDLRLGRYDEADAKLYLVNWSNPAEFDMVARGRIGTVTDDDMGRFTAEFRSESDILGQATGRLFQRTCGTILGSAACGVNISTLTYRLSSAILSVSGSVVTVAGATDYDDDWFALGTLTHVPSGATFRVRQHVGNSVVLWERPRFDMNVGETVVLVAGCRRTHAVCKDKFNNVANFQGFPFMPGQDYLSAYPIRSST